MGEEETNLMSKPAVPEILAFQLIQPLKLHLSYSIQSIQWPVVVFQLQYNFHTWEKSGKFTFRHPTTGMISVVDSRKA